MNLVELAYYDAGLAKRVELLANNAQRLGADDGVQRLGLVGKNFKKLSVSEAYNLLDASSLQQEVEAAQERKYLVGPLHIIRNCLALGPLIMTWAALYFASINYQQDLKKYPNDLYEPFLKLWQYGFHNTSWFTFSTAALFDVGLLSLYLLFVLLVAFNESRAQGKSRRFAVALRSVIEGLIDAITDVAGGSTAPASAADIDRVIRTIERVSDDSVNRLERAVKTISDVDADKIAQALKFVIEDALKTSEQVAMNAQQTIADLNADLQDLVKQLHLDLGTLSTNLLSYDKQVQDLTNASTSLAQASTSLAGNANDLTKSTQIYATVAKDISNQIGSLNTTQQQIITTMASIKQDATQQIGAFANSMDSAAKATGLVAQQLGQVTVNDINTMTKRVTGAADRVADAANELAKLQQALAQSDKHLQWAMSRADQHLQWTLTQADQRLQNAVVQLETQLQTTNAELHTTAQALAQVTALLGVGGGRRRRGKKPVPAPAPPHPRWQFWK